MTEAWRPVVGYEGLYEVSDTGRVRSVDAYVVNRPDGGVRLRRGRILRQAVIPGHPSRPVVSLSKENRIDQQYVHVLVLEAFAGPRPAGAVCRHLDGKAFNNTRSNLVWGTQKENIHDAIRHGTLRRGSQHGNALLTEEIVHLIRKSSEPSRVLAARFGVAPRTIRDAQRGITWKHVGAAA